MSSSKSFLEANWKTFLSEVDGIPGYAICAADGRMIGFSVNRDKAIGAIVQNELEPVGLH